MPELDHVTGLATRGDLHCLLESRHLAVAVVIADVVGLKAVNERDGFLAGDAVLRQAAERLRQAATEATIIARLGGDELVAVFAGPQAVQRARMTAATIVAVGMPLMRAAAMEAKPAEMTGSIIERAYAAMRRS
jgi:diguanylate cyclase (GGDEF)-like protein